MTTDKLQERRLQAMEIFRQQKEVVEQRQRQQLLKQIREQEYETRALDAMKEEYVSFFHLFINYFLIVYYLIVANDFVGHIPSEKIWKMIGLMLQMTKINVIKMKECICMHHKVFLSMNNVININVVLNVNVI
jgi:hypothetical protein